MMRPWSPALVMAFLLVAAMPGPGLAAESGLEVRIEGRLPEGNYRAASVTTDKEVLIFGGRDQANLTSKVMRYDFATGAASYAGYRLPQPRMSSCAAYDGRHAFIFGGSDGGLELDGILRVDTGTGLVQTQGTRLPSPRIGLVAAPCGGSIYIFGGHSNGTMTTEVLRFDPADGALGVMGAEVPTGRAGMGVLTTERGIYLFGGKTDGGVSDEVLLYKPQEDSLTVLPHRLPYPVYHAPAVLAGGKAFIIGGSAVLAGWSVSRATSTIVEFDPSTGESRVLDARLPSPRERAQAAYHEGTVFVFGGQKGVRALDEIVTIGPATGGGSGLPGQVQLAFLPTLLFSLSVAAVLTGTRRG